MGPNKQFKFVPADDGYFFIEPKHSNRVLDCDGDGNGRKLQLWDKGREPNKQFKFVPADDGYFFIEPKHSNRVLNCDGDSNGRKLLVPPALCTYLMGWFIICMIYL